MNINVNYIIFNKLFFFARVDRIKSKSFDFVEIYRSQKYHLINFVRISRRKILLFNEWVTSRRPSHSVMNYKGPHVEFTRRQCNDPPLSFIRVRNHWRRPQLRDGTTTASSLRVGKQDEERTRDAFWREVCVSGGGEIRHEHLERTRARESSFRII